MEGTVRRFGMKSLSRRRFLKFAGIGATALAFGGCTEPQRQAADEETQQPAAQPVDGRRSAPRRPNILLAIADDQSWPYAGAYGATVVQTPAFDRVATEGVLLNHAYCPAPQCSPSRAALLTGRNIWQLEEAGTHASLFPAKFTVYPDLLADAGYHTGYTGKPWGPGDWKTGGRTENPAGPGYNSVKLEPPAKGISNNDYAGNFERFLAARPQDAPFCFWYGAFEPHRTYEQGVGIRAGKDPADVILPNFLPDHEIVRADITDYAYEIEWFDRHLGRMIAKLEEMGELDNTIIVVTADNGMPFPRAKANLYEFGTHVPMAIRWGDAVRSGRVIDDFVSFIDLAPTLCEAAGVPVPEAMTGRSLMNVLTSSKAGQVDRSRDYVLTGRERHTHARPDNVGYPSRAIRTERFLYIYNFAPDRWPAGDPTNYHDIDGSPTKTFLLDNQDKYPVDEYFDLAMAKRPREELFDLTHDPECMVNVAAYQEYALEKEKLRDRLEALLTRQGDPRVLGYGDIFDSYPRISPMRGNEFEGFAERGEYNPAFQKLAEEARASGKKPGLTP